MLEPTDGGGLFCNICSHDSAVAPASRSERARREGGRRFASLDELVARAGVRRDELVTLADIGALNSFGYDRRSALVAGRARRAAIGRAVHDDQRRGAQRTQESLSSDQRILCETLPRALR